MAFDEGVQKFETEADIQRDIAFHRSRIDALVERRARAKSAAQRALESRQRVASQAEAFGTRTWKRVGGVVVYPQTEQDSAVTAPWGKGMDKTKGTLFDEVDEGVHTAPQPAKTIFVPDRTAITIHNLCPSRRRRRSESRTFFKAFGWFRRRSEKYVSRLTEQRSDCIM